MQFTLKGNSIYDSIFIFEVKNGMRPQSISDSTVKSDLKTSGKLCHLNLYTTSGFLIDNVDRITQIICCAEMHLSVAEPRSGRESSVQCALCEINSIKWSMQIHRLAMTKGPAFKLLSTVYKLSVDKIVNEGACDYEQTFALKIVHGYMFFFLMHKPASRIQYLHITNTQRSSKCTAKCSISYSHFTARFDPTAYA